MSRRADAPTMNAIEKWLCLLLAGALNLVAAEKPADKTLPVRGFCIPAPSGNRVDEFIKFIEEELAPRSVNALILRVDYGFQFVSRLLVAPQLVVEQGQLPVDFGNWSILAEFLCLRQCRFSLFVTMIHTQKRSVK